MNPILPFNLRLKLPFYNFWRHRIIVHYFDFALLHTLLNIKNNDLCNWKNIWKVIQYCETSAFEKFHISIIHMFFLYFFSIFQTLLGFLIAYFCFCLLYCINFYVFQFLNCAWCFVFVYWTDFYTLQKNRIL